MLCYLIVTLESVLYRSISNLFLNVIKCKNFSWLLRFLKILPSGFSIAPIALDKIILPLYLIELKDTDLTLI